MEWEKQFDPVALGKGRNLFCSGKVMDVKRTEKEITASVGGIPRCEVTIGMRENVPVRMHCQCPKFRGRSNCEHLAAALYAVYSDEVDKEKARLAQEEEARARQVQRQAQRAAAMRREADRQRREAREEKKRQDEEKKRLELEEKKRQVEEEKRRQAQEEEQRRESERQKRLEEEWQRRKREQEIFLQKLEEEKREKEEREAKKKAEEDRKREEERAFLEEMEKKEKEEAQRAGGDGYCYFDFIRLRKALKISTKNIREGRLLLQNDAVTLQRVADGFTENGKDMAVEVIAVGREKKKEFPVRITFDREEILHVTCGCADCSKKYWGWYSRDRNCAYVSAAMELAAAYIKQHGIGDATDKTAAYVLRAFQQKHVSQVMAMTQQRDESLRLEPRLQKSGNTLRLSFRVGAGKLFVVKDLFAFCNHVRNSETAVYGSNTPVNHRLENFTQESREWYNFINKVIQEEERLEQRLEESMRYSYRGSRLNALELYGWRLDQFYEMVGNGSLEYEEKTFGEKKKSSISCKEGNPYIAVKIEPNVSAGTGIFHGISVSCGMPVFFYGVGSAYYVEHETLLRVKKEFMERVQTLADISGGGNLAFKVGRRQLSEFYYSLLPALGDSVEIEEQGQEQIRKYLQPEAAFVFYLDAENENMTCRVHALYGDKEISVLDYLQKEDPPVLESFRMEGREQEILYRAMQLFPAADLEADVLHCKGEQEQMYEVMEHGVDELMALGEVRCTNRFRNMNVVRRVKMSVGVSVSEGLLDLDIGTQDIPREELLDILKSYRTKQRFYRLKNGDFLNLEDSSLQMLHEMMETLHVSAKEFLKGKLHLPAYRVLYMDKLLEEHAEIYNTRDSRFKKMVKNFKTINDADFEEPKSLSHILRGYQKNGFKWLKTLEAYGFGGILADDMGLGKTLQMIAVLLAAKQEGQKGTSLIVCPASLVYNWAEELRRFAPILEVGIIAGSQEARQERLAASDSYDVLITSYDLLKRDIGWYEGKRFLYHVIDEAQYIKNHTTAAAKAVKVIEGRYRFALTGTPIENRLSELWSIFDFLMPGFLYGYDVFKREMETPITKGQDPDALSRLQKMTGPFILRRLKQDVLKDLPDKLEEVRYVQMEEVQRKAYDAQVVHMQNQLHSQSGEDFNKNRMQILAELTRLRQICCDPSLCFENYGGESAKLEACLDLITSAIDGGHKILLFSQFTTMLEILQEKLEKAGIAHYVITGNTDKEKRLQLVNTFNADATPLFLISLKAGGVGLNLTGADVVIHYDPWWNLAAQEQATDRAHRIGQTRKVTVYKLIARQTVEEKILALQETKQNLADSIVNSQMGQLAGMSKEELLDLLTA